jgi:spore coat polysaccharide biosynthesis predicted glycosyltransferase SpsG
MYALCIESSHTRGMGHLYRALNLATALSEIGIYCKFFINDHDVSRKIITSRKYTYEVVDLNDFSSDWETKFIIKYKVNIWINDRLNTNIQHAKKVKANDVPLVTFDDRGSGAAICDLHIAALVLDATERLAGKFILRGSNYLILNPEILKYRHLRTSLKNILVTLGGSDTHGVTVKLVEALANQGRSATIIVGAGFEHNKELNKVLTKNFEIKHNVPSLIEEFSKYDLAITGGGITAFEANASGLPCIIVANELFEMPAGKDLELHGGAVFAGYHEAIDFEIFKKQFPISQMSQAAMDYVKLDGCDQVVNAITKLEH